MPSPLDGVDLRRRVQACLDAELARPGRACSPSWAPTSTTSLDARSPPARAGASGCAPPSSTGATGPPAGPTPTPSCAWPARWSSSRPRRSSTTTSWTTPTPDAGCRPPTARSRPSTPSGAGGATSDRFGLAGAVLAGNLCLTWTDEVYATSGLPGPTSPAAGASSTGCAPSSWPASSSTSSSRCARGTASPTTSGWSAPAGHPLQEREVHRRAPAAHRGDAGGLRRRRPRRPVALRPRPRPGLPAARRPARRLRRPRARPASRPATTCARASARCCIAHTLARHRRRRARATRGPARPPRPRRRRGRRAARRHRRAPARSTRLEDEIDRPRRLAPARPLDGGLARRRGPRGLPTSSTSRPPAPPDARRVAAGRSIPEPFRFAPPGDVARSVRVPRIGRERRRRGRLEGDLHAPAGAPRS